MLVLSLIEPLLLFDLVSQVLGDLHVFKLPRQEVLFKTDSGLSESTLLHLFIQAFSLNIYMLLGVEGALLHELTSQVFLSAVIVLLSWRLNAALLSRRSGT